MPDAVRSIRSWVNTAEMRLRRLGELLRGFRTADRMLALLRLAVFVGAALWTLAAPIPVSVRLDCGLLLSAFLGYSALLLWTVRRWPSRARAIYLGALAVDLVFLSVLFRNTGGISSPFLPAAFLLAALTASHYGPVLGVLAAWAALGLSALSDTSRLAEHHWSELPLVFLFAALTAGYLGWLARRKADERRDIERLHDELGARARDLEAAYDKCREAQDHLVLSERLATIGRMSAEVAHHVRNPLSSISLNLELLEDEMMRGVEPLQPEARQLISAIQNEIDNLAAVTENYLGFANLPPLRWEWASLNGIVREILVFAQPQFERHEATVTQLLQDGLPMLRADRRQLKFAIMNVLANAIEAVRPGGRVRVRTRPNADGVELVIADTGEGIPPENVPKVFDPFFTTKQGGTGLGLSLARRIVESHGGRISLRSIPRVGTTFTMLLPRDGWSNGRPSDDEGRACGR